MDPEYKAKWLAALRSGEYQQACYCFIGKKENTFCGLGVLCKINPEVTIVEEEGLTCFAYKGTSSASFLPPPLRQELGVHFDTQERLTDMNDNDKKTFQEIADWIEENL